MTNVGEIITTLKEYEFKYYFSKDELENQGFHNIEIKNPIYFATGENEDVLSVMAFGGCIGWISTSEHKKYLNKKEIEKIESFAKYLSPKEKNDTWYINGNGHSIYLPNALLKDENYQYDKRAKIKNILKDEEKKFNGKVRCNQIFLAKGYLDLMVCAAYVRYMHRSLNKTKEKTLMLDVSERSIQTVIARKNLDNCKEQDMVVIDIEFKEPIELAGGKSKIPSVDFVVLDKKTKSFGLIEFKYQGKSMNPRLKRENKEGNEKIKGDNSLTTHFEDFMILIQKKREHIIKRLIDHTDILLNKKIIVDDNGEVKKVLEKIKSNQGKKGTLWCGFYFVDDKDSKKKVTSRNGRRMTMNDRILYDCYMQVVKEYNENAEKYEIDLQCVRYQHSDVKKDDYWKLTMDENFKEKKFEEIKDLHKNSTPTPTL